MIPVVTIADMKRVDDNTIEKFHMPQAVLMERAALFMERVILEKIFPGKEAGKLSVLIAVGNGNNGGDGVALGRLLKQRGCRVTLLFAGSKSHHSGKSSDALKKQLEIALLYHVSIVHDIGELCPEYDLIVDALFGVGLSRMVEGYFAQIIEALNKISGWKMAVDISSGVHADTGQILGAAFAADITVTFGFLKAGCLLYPGKKLTGKIFMDSVGITEDGFMDKKPEGVTLMREDGWKSIAKVREADSHKGTYGRVLLFSGSRKTPGASILAALAALRTGAGMVKVISPKVNRDLLIQSIPEVMFSSMEENLLEDAVLLDNINWCSCIVAGPGIGQEPLALKLLLQIAKFAMAGHKPLILDADGCNLYAQEEVLRIQIKENIEHGCAVIMTPHMGEFSRMMKTAVDVLKTDHIGFTREFCAKTGIILTSKDAATVVSCYQNENQTFRYYVNQTGNSGMATAGSGDVLSGVIGACIAAMPVTEDMFSYWDNVIKAVYLHGMAGDVSALKNGETSMRASDMLEALSEITK